MNEEQQNNTENRFGISQDSIEEFRSEFQSIGSVVTKLPDISEVREFTTLMIPIKVSAVLNYERWQAIDGAWFYLGLASPTK